MQQAFQKDAAKDQNRAGALRNLLVGDCSDEVLDKHFNSFAKPRSYPINK